MTSSRGSINAAPATITSESDTERRLAERAAITAITVMSRSRSQGTEVTIVTEAFPFELPRDITENSPLWETQTCCRCKSIHAAVSAAAENPLELRRLLLSWPKEREMDSFILVNEAREAEFQMSIRLINQ